LIIDYRKAHGYASYNRESLLRSSICGCFSCLRIYRPAAIAEWIDEEEGKIITALCPYCHVDAVIGSASGCPITKDFLEDMYQCWFEGHDHILKQQDATRANQEHLKILKGGVELWNEWRFQNPETTPDLIFADLSHLDLSGINLRHARLRSAKFHSTNLSTSNLAGADLTQAQLSHAVLRDANLSRALLHFSAINNADLSFADLRKADLSDATLSHANLSDADLQGANLSNANMEGACLVHATLRSANLALAHFSQADLRTADLRFSTFLETDLTNADLTGCWVRGASLGNVQIEGAKQYDLLLTDEDSLNVTSDQFYMAHVLSLFLEKQNIRILMQVSMKKMVFVLGYFEDKREEILHVVKDFLRVRGYWVVFLKTSSTLGPEESEMIAVLSHLALFSIADGTNNKELFRITQEIAPSLPYHASLILQETDDTEKIARNENNVSPPNFFLYRFRNVSELSPLLEELCKHATSNDEVL
jgi:uncharacterized protein YjbI with pentapeptide repeats